MIYDSWYVLSGGPSSGKTTLLNELRQRGYNTVKEAARYHIETQFAQGLTIEKIRESEKLFQEEVFKYKQIVHDSLDTQLPTFFDRGYHDTIAYLRYFEYEIADFILKVSKNNMYKKVFILDMLPYQKDEARTENEKIAKGLHESIEATYKNSSHEIVHVPVLPVKKRADFILENM